MAGSPIFRLDGIDLTQADRLDQNEAPPRARIDLERSLRQPLVVHESGNTLRLMEQLRQSPLQMAVVVDEYGSLEGIATPTDVLKAIAGDFVYENEEEVTAERQEEGSWLVDGWIDIRCASD